MEHHAPKLADLRRCPASDLLHSAPAVSMPSSTSLWNAVQTAAMSVSAGMQRLTRNRMEKPRQRCVSVKKDGCISIDSTPSTRNCVFRWSKGLGS